MARPAPQAPIPVPAPCQVEPMSGYHSEVELEEGRKLGRLVSIVGPSEGSDKASAQITSAFQRIEDKHQACVMLFKTMLCASEHPDSSLANILSAKVQVLCGDRPDALVEAHNMKTTPRPVQDPRTNPAQRVERTTPPQPSSRKRSSITAEPRRVVEPLAASPHPIGNTATPVAISTPVEPPPGAIEPSSPRRPVSGYYRRGNYASFERLLQQARDVKFANLESNCFDFRSHTKNCGGSIDPPKPGYPFWHYFFLLDSTDLQSAREMYDELRELLLQAAHAGGYSEEQEEIDGMNRTTGVAVSNAEVTVTMKRERPYGNPDTDRYTIAIGATHDVPPVGP